MSGLRHGTSDTRRKNGFGVDAHGHGIVSGIFFGGFFLVALGLSRLVSGKTSGKMQVSFGSDVQNCCKRLISTFASVFSVFYNISVLSLFRSMCVCSYAGVFCAVLCVFYV